jgi:hypothetical protein
MAVEAEKAAGKLAEQGIDAEISDLRTFKPFNRHTILALSTKRQAVGGWRSCGISAEIAALVAQEGGRRYADPSACGLTCRPRQSQPRAGVPQRLHPYRRGGLQFDRFQRDRSGSGRGLMCSRSLRRSDEKR